MKNVVYLITITLGLILITFLYLAFQTNEAAKSQDLASCGVIDVPRSMPKGEHYIRGKKVFKRDCATCHSKDMKTNTTGPALAENIEHWLKDTTAFKHFIQSEKEYINTTKDARIVALRKAYLPIEYDHTFRLSDNECIDLLVYLEYASTH